MNCYLFYINPDLRKIPQNTHRRIQNFVRGPSWPPGGGQDPLGPPGSAPDYLREQFFVGGGGGQGPLGPPGSAPDTLYRYEVSRQ